MTIIHSSRGPWGNISTGKSFTILLSSFFHFSDFADISKFMDYDSCSYEIIKDADHIKFGFSSLCTADIMQNGGTEMLAEVYPEWPVLQGAEAIEDTGVSIKIPY